MVQLHQKVTRNISYNSSANFPGKSFCSASQPFWCHGPLLAETLFWGLLHEKFVSEQSFIRGRKLLQNESVKFIAHF